LFIIKSLEILQVNIAFLEGIPKRIVIKINYFIIFIESLADFYYLTHGNVSPTRQIKKKTQPFFKADNYTHSLIPLRKIYVISQYCRIWQLAG